MIRGSPKRSARWTSLQKSFKEGVRGRLAFVILYLPKEVIRNPVSGIDQKHKLHQNHHLIISTSRIVSITNFRV
jgi:hypothetical protein